MKKTPLLLSSVLLLSLFGCAGGGSQTGESPTPTPPKETVSKETGVERAQAPEKQSLPTPSALIPSTPPDRRLQQITKGRGDPFAPLTPPRIGAQSNPPTPIAKPPMPSNAGGGRPLIASIQEPSRASLKDYLRRSLVPSPTPLEDNRRTYSPRPNNRNIARIPTGATGLGKTTPTRNLDKGGTVARANTAKTSPRSGATPVKTLPPPPPPSTTNLTPPASGQASTPPTVPVAPPEPVLAKQVVVTGVLDYNGEKVAFVSIPWDSSVRRLRVGDVLVAPTGDGKVTVKDIRFLEGTKIALTEEGQTVMRPLNNSGGVVILEEYGQLVERRIGEAQTVDASKDTKES